MHGNMNYRANINTAPSIVMELDTKI